MSCSSSNPSSVPGAAPGSAPPLLGRGVVVTGVSRRAGIGYAIARRAAELGAEVFCHHFAPHDAQQPWGGDELEAVLEGVRERVRPGGTFAHLHADLADPAQPARVLAAARRALGRVDGLVVNQAMSGSDGPLSSITAEELDRHWAVDARASWAMRPRRPPSRASSRRWRTSSRRWASG